MAVRGYGNMTLAQFYWTEEELAIDKIRRIIRSSKPLDLDKLDSLLELVNGEFYDYHIEDKC